MAVPKQQDHPPSSMLDSDNEPLLDSAQPPSHSRPRQVGFHPNDHIDPSDGDPYTLDGGPAASRSSRSLDAEDEGDDGNVPLEGMMDEDPLERSGMTKRASWGAVKQEAWVDTGQQRGMLDPASKETEARKMGNKKFMRNITINCVLIALWYMLSIAMSVYNKWMFSPGNLDFHFPLFSTSVHMLVQFLLASSVLFFFPRFRPSSGSTDNKHEDVEEAPPPPPVSSPSSTTTPKKPLMTPWFYLTRIASCGAVTGLDIGLGNTSLKFISLTFFTMVKSSTLGFVLGFAIIFRLEAPSWKIGGIIAVMTLGVILMVSGETAFDGVGFALLMGASFFSGLRWSLTQILLRRTPATSNPFSTLFFLTPVMFVVLFVLAVPAETFPALGAGLDRLAAQQGLAMGLLIVLFPGCIAFCMTAAEFALLKRTSVVTLSVCGIFKEVLTITAAGFIFGDELTPINVSGLVITILAIAVYNYTRMRNMKRWEIQKARNKGAAPVPATPSSPAHHAPPPAAAPNPDDPDVHDERAPILPPSDPDSTPAAGAGGQPTTVAPRAYDGSSERRYDDADADADLEGDGDDVVMILGPGGHDEHGGRERGAGRRGRRQDGYEAL